MVDQTELVQNVRDLVKQQLRPLVDKIDQEGLYPETFMRELGAIGGYASVGTEAEGGNGLGMFTQIEVLRAVGAECGATAFSAWCQTACAWYLHQSGREAVRQRYLKDVLQGKVLAGTGLSNMVKHLAKIEKHLLQAQKVEGGYVVNGSLPWVSNIGENHVWASSAQLEDGGYIMFVSNGQMENLSLHDCPEFCALEGTRTFSARYVNVLIKSDDLLADEHEFTGYVQKIKTGFVLSQMGIGAGVIDGCLGVIRMANVSSAEVNQYLDHSFGDIRAQLDSVMAQTEHLSRLVWENKPDALGTLKLRALGSELTLAASQSAALHAGAKGYLMRSPAQRRMREAMFVAIVTPALKHLRKEIAALEAI